MRLRLLACAASTNPISWPGLLGTGKFERPEGPATRCVEEQGTEGLVVGQQ